MDSENQLQLKRTTVQSMNEIANVLEALTENVALMNDNLELVLEGSLNGQVKSLGRKMIDIATTRSNTKLIQQENTQAGNVDTNKRQRLLK
mmetsp:Transcript_6915/g.8718  ORF Transcript_6915/g.8718 Transcript_6915/m.8718 type:complete len:91 (+) Transcript_6915:442-714(+)|eukprot:CAMPEP_0204831518 /NCGR_PEP_ID=MMETSP1346-20131115/10826_1 /ASSEMBLY_ACC=CAM_ASM_000771 /TAXON_ID=215587 /ORGANISM="Aplanochytrium stocchinoi, Strain GSBS06" /LENGTH=90 /DNA_ID=CAMNT_0051962611 /DNA_START=393 /DNA_END=665 /DNA_ORIENTATION=-